MDVGRVCDRCKKPITSPWVQGDNVDRSNEMVMDISDLTSNQKEQVQKLVHECRSKNNNWFNQKLQEIKNNSNLNDEAYISGYTQGVTDLALKIISDEHPAIDYLMSLGVAKGVKDIL